MKKEPLKHIVLHPFLFSVYPVAALLGYNIGEIRVNSAARAFVLALLLAGIFLYFGRFLFRDWQRAGVLALCLLVPFFSYGHLYEILPRTGGLGQVFGRHRVLLPLFALTFTIIVWRVLRRDRDWHALTSVLNLTALALIIFPLYQVSSSLIRTRSEAIAAVKLSDSALGLIPTGVEERPDIYFIITDSYARQDVLAEKYGFDNGPFLKKLKALGFYVVECGQSNYSKTAFSVAATLNLDYIDTFGDEGLFKLDQEGRPDTTKFGPLIQHSKTRNILEALGYKTVSFATGYSWLDWTDADLYSHRFAEDPASLSKSLFFGPVNEFEALLARTTFIQALSDMGVIFGVGIMPQGGLRAPVDLEVGALHQDYRRTLFILDSLEGIADLEGPKFVYAHILPPHPPYIFLPDGRFTDQDTHAEASYPKQIAFLNDRLISVFESLLENSEIPPVIILQGDHGSPETIGEPARVYALNAIYLPGGGGGRLYPTFTPVNTFRLVFDLYFGAHIGLLDDVSYNHRPQRRVPNAPILFDAVPNSCKK